MAQPSPAIGLHHCRSFTQFSLPSHFPRHCHPSAHALHRLPPRRKLPRCLAPLCSCLDVSATSAPVSSWLGSKAFSSKALLLPPHTRTSALPPVPTLGLVLCHLPPHSDSCFATCPSRCHQYLTRMLAPRYLAAGPRLILCLCLLAFLNFFLFRAFELLSFCHLASWTQALLWGLEIYSPAPPPRSSFAGLSDRIASGSSSALLASLWLLLRLLMAPPSSPYGSSFVSVCLLLRLPMAPLIILGAPSFLKHWSFF